MEQVYRARKGHGLVILAVNLDTGPRSMVEAFVKELELTFPILLDPRGASARTYQVLGLPTSYLIDRDGRLVRQELGPRNWSLGEARAKLEALLK